MEKTVEDNKYTCKYKHWRLTHNYWD